MDNIFERDDISFHGIRELDFFKLKDILENGILPSSMLPKKKTNSEFDVDSVNASRVFLTISPSILGPFKSRGFSWYVKYNIGIVVDKKLDNVPTNGSFPDCGFCEGPIDPDLFIGLTILKEIYESNVRSLREGRKRVCVDDSLRDYSIADIIDIYNTNLLPIYDSETGELLKDYSIRKK